MKGLRRMRDFLRDNSLLPSELTWFMKGLRHAIAFAKSIKGVAVGPNWPDLWRDCDHCLDLLKDNPRKNVRIDLIYEGIATLSMFALWPLHLLSELTWFMKGLRLTTLNVDIELAHCSGSELTWFMKGLRLCICSVGIRCPLIVRIDLIYEGIATRIQRRLFVPYFFVRPNWPDLWRDCDFSPLPMFCNVSIVVRIDLIYEGIATRFLSLFRLELKKNCPNWPDLWRDCDFI